MCRENEGKKSIHCPRFSGAWKRFPARSIQSRTKTKTIKNHHQIIITKSQPPHGMPYNPVVQCCHWTTLNQGLEVDAQDTPQEVPAVKNIIWWLRTLAPPWWRWTLEAGQRIVVRLSMRLRACWAVVSYIALFAHSIIHPFFRHFAFTLAWACWDRLKLASVQEHNLPSSREQKTKTLFWI